MFIAVVKDPVIAEDIRSRSPLRLQVPYPLEATRFNDSHPLGLALSRASVAAKQQVADDAAGQAAPDAKSDVEDVHQEFYLTIHHAPEFDHQLSATKNPYHKDWPKLGMDSQSMGMSALQHVVPGGVTGKGLAYWNFITPWDREESKTAPERFVIREWTPSRMGLKELEMKKGPDEIQDAPSTLLAAKPQPPKPQRQPRQVHSATSPSAKSTSRTTPDMGANRQKRQKQVPARSSAKETPPMDKAFEAMKSLRR